MKNTDRTVGRNRLRALAYFLLTLPEEKFNMRIWAGRNSTETYNFVLNEFSCDLNKCGTAACAFGWASEIFPELERTPDGFRIVKPGATRGRKSKTAYSIDEIIALAAKFFGLRYAEADYLFAPEGMGNVTTQDEAQRILNLVQELEARE